MAVGEADARADAGAKAIVSVANTGPGIPPEQVHRRFDPSRRLDRTRVDNHHGLGRSIARALWRAPRVLIMDAVTSPGGFWLRGRPTIAVAHRRSTVRAADQLDGRKEGRGLERGAHDVLVAAGER